MSTPLGAVTRIELRYTCDSFAHKLRVYVAQDPAAFTPRHILKRDGVTSISWIVAAQALWDAVRGTMATTTPAAAAVLQNNVVGTGIWTPTDTVALTGIGTMGGQAFHAQEIVTVIRDTAFKFVRFCTFETGLGAVTGHSATGIGIGIDTFINTLNGVSTGANEPWTWMLARGARYMAATGAISGCTLGINKKIRRRRGLA